MKKELIQLYSDPSECPMGYYIVKAKLDNIVDIEEKEIGQDAEIRCSTSANQSYRYKEKGFKVFENVCSANVNAHREFL
ncbi:MAG: hypothetical protein QXM43_02005 [Desulfurococcaceae archaeon]